MFQIIQVWCWTRHFGKMAQITVGKNLKKNWPQRLKWTFLKWANIQSEDFFFWKNVDFWVWDNLIYLICILYSLHYFYIFSVGQENGEQEGALVHLQPILVEQIQNSNEETYFLNQEESKIRKHKTKIKI